MDKSTLKEGFLGQRIIILPNEVKNRLKINPITSNFHISDIGYFPKASTHFRKRKKDHGTYIFIYCIEGSGWVKTDGIKTIISPNQYIIIPKHLAHTYKSDKTDPWSIYWMHFDGKIAETLYNKHRPNKNETISFNSDRIKLFNQIFEILNNTYLEAQLEYANILSLNFISAFIYNNIDATVNINKYDNLVGSITAFLNNNLGKSLKAEDIAKAFNLSTSYTQTLFKKGTGYSLIHFFNLKKTQKACEYLNYTNLSIKEISIKLGFKDPLYFSRLFKNYMGVSPKAYKQRNN